MFVLIIFDILFLYSVRFRCTDCSCHFLVLSYEWVSLNFPAVCWGAFLELDHYDSLNFGMVLETLIKLFVTELDFLGKFFLPAKIGEIGQK